MLLPYHSHFLPIHQFLPMTIISLSLPIPVFLGVLIENNPIVLHHVNQYTIIITHVIPAFLIIRLLWPSWLLSLDFFLHPQPTCAWLRFPLSCHPQLSPPPRYTRSLLLLSHRSPPLLTLALSPPPILPVLPNWFSPSVLTLSYSLPLLPYRFPHSFSHKHPPHHPHLTFHTLPSTPCQTIAIPSLSLTDIPSEPSPPQNIPTVSLLYMSTLHHSPTCLFPPLIHPWFLCPLRILFWALLFPMMFCLKSN